MDVQEIEQEYVSSWKNPIDDILSGCNAATDGSSGTPLRTSCFPDTRSAYGSAPGLSLSHPSPGLMHTGSRAGFPP